MVPDERKTSLFTLLAVMLQVLLIQKQRVPQLIQKIQTLQIPRAADSCSRASRPKHLFIKHVGPRIEKLKNLTLHLK